MNIYFCEKCGRRVSDQEIDEGQGINDGVNGVFCKACYVPPPPRKAGGTALMQRKPSGQQVARSGGKLPAAAAMIPAPRMVAASTSRAPEASAAARAQNSKLASRNGDKASSASMYAGIAVGVVVLGGALLFFSRSTPPEKTVAAKTNSKTEARPSSVETKAAENKTVATPPPVQPTTEVKPEAQPQPPVVTGGDSPERDFEALSAKIQALQDNPSARITAAEEFIRKYPDHILAIRARRVVEEARKPVTAGPVQPPVDNSDLPTAAQYADRGYKKMLEGELESGVADAEKAVKLDDAPWNFHAILAVGYYAQNKTDEYRTALGAAITKGGSPTAVETTLKRDGERAKNMALGKSLDNKIPATALDFGWRGTWRYQQGRLDEAHNDLIEALKLDGSLGQNGLFSLLSEIAGKKNDHKARLEWFQRWADSTPASADGMNNYAWELLNSADEKLRDLKAALPYAAKAVELTKEKNAAVLDTYAYALFKNDKVKEAIATQEKAIALLAPANPMRVGLEMRLNEMKEAAGQK